jgi:hypothetical protein
MMVLTCIQHALSSVTHISNSELRTPALITVSKFGLEFLIQSPVCKSEPPEGTTH